MDVRDQKKHKIDDVLRCLGFRPLYYKRRKTKQDASKTRKPRLFRRERTWTYVTKKKRKVDDVLRRIFFVF